MQWRFVALLAVAGAVACSESNRAQADLSGATTAVDSTGDTIVVRVTGDVSAERARTLVEELRIAPTLDDTSTFAEVFEFEVDGAGRMWVFDNSSNRIFLFDANGALLRTVGRRGSGPGEFAANGGMVAVGDSGIALWDPRNARVSFFAGTGEFVRSFPTPAGFATSDGLLRDADGALYLRRPVTDPREGEILGRMGLVRLDSAGAFTDSLEPPDIAVPREAYVASKTTKGGTSRSATNSEHAGQYLWAWHPRGHFVIGNGVTYEIIVARPAGKPVSIRRESTPVALTPEQRDEDEQRILWQMHNVDPSWTWQGPALPRTKAPLLQVTVTRDGRIWARVATPSEAIPEDELTPQRKDGPPVRRFRAPQAWEVYHADGHFLGRVAFPARTALVQAEGDRVWAIGRDENDLPAILRLRIEPSLAPSAGR